MNLLHSISLRSFKIEHLWAQPPKLLTQIAERDKEFTEKYLLHLDSQIANLVSHRTQNAVCWKLREGISKGLGYDEIVLHFSRLRCSPSDNVKQAANELLDKKISLAESSAYFNIKIDSVS